jgi:hypothetical protein
MSCSKIDVAVFGDDQFILRKRPVLKVKFSSNSVFRSCLGYQAAAAFRICNSIISVMERIRCGFVLKNHPVQVINREFFFKGIAFSFDGNLAQRTDWLVNKKSNVNSKWSPVRIHDNSSKIGGVLKIIACGVTQVKFF